jgi:hypothetical protein
MAQWLAWMRDAGFDAEMTNTDTGLGELWFLFVGVKK